MDNMLIFIICLDGPARGKHQIEEDTIGMGILIGRHHYYFENYVNGKNLYRYVKPVRNGQVPVRS